MRIYEEKTRPALKEKVCVRRRCDLCGLESKSADWLCGAYEIAESEVKVSVTQRTGESYPEGGVGTEFEVDICPQCFKDKLVPWLKSQGANVVEQEWDW